MLRETLTHTAAEDPGAAAAHESGVDQEVGPWVDATVWFDRHRLAEMAAEVRGEPYPTEDPGWAMSVALRTGAAADPVLARAAARIGGLLALPPDTLGDPEVARRLGPWVGASAPAGPSRADVLAAARTTARSPAQGPELADAR